MERYGTNMNLEALPNLHLQNEPEASPYVMQAIQNLSKINAESLLEEELLKYSQILQKSGNFKVGIIVLDDQTPNLVSREMIDLGRVMDSDLDMKRGCMSLVWWTSDPVNPEKVRLMIAEQLFKCLRVHDGKLVRTLSELVNLEAQTIRFSKAKSADKKRQMWFSDFAKYMLTADRGTMIACFYGDQAARRIGHRALGFPSDAGRTYANWMA